MTRGLLSGVLRCRHIVRVRGCRRRPARPDSGRRRRRPTFSAAKSINCPIDEHGRLTLGPELQRVHDGGVPFVWTLLPAPDGSVFLGTGNDGKVIRVDRAGQRHRLLRQLRARGARAGERAERAALRRHLAGRAHLPRRRARPRRNRSSIPTTNTSGRSRSIARASSSPPPATRASSIGSRRTASRPSSSRPRPCTPSRWPSMRAASCWSAPDRPVASSASTPPAKAFSSSTRPIRRFTRFASTRRA